MELKCRIHTEPFLKNCRLGTSPNIVKIPRNLVDTFTRAMVGREVPGEGGGGEGADLR